MSNSKRIISILISAACALAPCLASCAKNDASAAADLVQISSRAPSNYRTVETVKGDVLREYSAQASIDYNVEAVLYQGEDIGKLKEVHTFNRQQVKAGDLIAEIELDNALLTDEREKLRLNIENAESYLELEKESIRDGIAEMSASLAEAPARDADILKLKIEKAMLEYEYHVYEAELTINGWKKDMAEIEKKLLGVKIYAPIDGLVFNVTTISRGDAIEPGTLILHLYYNESLRLNLNADPANFRYNMEVEIAVANDLTYKGRIISDPVAANPDGGSLDFKIEILDAPSDTVAFLNLISNRRITVTGKSTELIGVPVIPYNTIYNENGKRYVMLLEDNIVKKRYIQLGLYNFQAAEIVSGLRTGDRVLE